MTLTAKLKKVCKKCNATTIKTYEATIKRAYRLVKEDGEMPLNHKWVSAALEKIKKQELGKRRHLQIGMVKYLQALDSAPKLLERATKEMLESADAYKKQREKQQWSTSEMSKRPAKGLKALSDAAKEVGVQVRRMMRFEKEANLRTLYQYQAWLLLQLYADVPLRNTWATFELVDKKTNNFIRTGKGKFKLFVRQHKNSKKTGEAEIELNRRTTMRIRKFLNYRKKVNLKNDSLFVTLKGDPMTRGALSKFLHRTTKRLLGNGFGSRLIRVLSATENKEHIEKSAELANKMLHSTKQQRTYVRKD